MTFITYGSLLYSDSANCAKFGAVFAAVLGTPAGVAGCGETRCPSLETGYPGTDTRVWNNTQSDRQTD